MRTDTKEATPELWALYAPKAGAPGRHPLYRNRPPECSGAVIPDNSTHPYGMLHGPQALRASSNSSARNPSNLYESTVYSSTRLDVPPPGFCHLCRLPHGIDTLSFDHLFMISPRAGVAWTPPPSCIRSGLWSGRMCGCSFSIRSLLNLQVPSWVANARCLSHSCAKSGLFATIAASNSNKKHRVQGSKVEGDLVDDLK